MFTTRVFPWLEECGIHDNIEEKHVLDILAGFCLKSDSGLYVDTVHMTRLGEEDTTRLYIMDSRKFPDWICEKSMFLSIEKMDSEKS